MHISAQSGVPVYMQIEYQIRQAVAAGLLQQDELLPSTRHAAAELCVNPNTVARAYTNLEREGVIRTVPGGGTFVAKLNAQQDRLSESEKLRRLRPLAEHLAVESAQLGVPSATLHRLLSEAQAHYRPFHPEAPRMASEGAAPPTTTQKKPLIPNRRQKTKQGHRDTGETR